MIIAASILLLVSCAVLPLVWAARLIGRRGREERIARILDSWREVQ
jgi:hypothetical protein